MLVIDDESSIRMVLNLHLTHAGYEVTQCSTGSEGLEFAISGAFDLVLCDLKLPDISGVDIIRSVRKNCKNTPIVAVSGFMNEDLISEVTATGNVGYLSKPFLKRELLDIVSKSLNNS